MSEATNGDAITTAAASDPPATDATGAQRAVEWYHRQFDRLLANVATVIRGKDDVIRMALVAMTAQGHVLFEDLPGTGKSMLARALAGSFDTGTDRIQCTPDMLPGDITGSSVLNQAESRFEFHPGPVFTHVLLADEINRATPKTQSALLEAMAERRVTTDGVTRDLPDPFFVLATQNPIEQAGTFPLPEAQLDRFLFKLSMGYPDRDAEYQVMTDNSTHLLVDDLKPVADVEVARKMIRAAALVQMDRQVGYYIVDLVQASRQDPAVAAGGSPRATIALMRAARALAASDGRAHVYPDDVRRLLVPVLGHRIILRPEAVLGGETVADVVGRVAASVRPPVAAGAGAG